MRESGQNDTARNKDKKDRQRKKYLRDLALLTLNILVLVESLSLRLFRGLQLSLQLLPLFFKLVNLHVHAHVRPMDRHHLGAFRYLYTSSTCVCVHVHACTCICIYMYVCTRLCICVHVCICICAYTRDPCEDGEEDTHGCGCTCPGIWNGQQDEWFPRLALDERLPGQGLDSTRKASHGSSIYWEKAQHRA